MWLKTVLTILCKILIIHLLMSQDTSSFQRKGFTFGASFGIANTNISYPNKSTEATDLGIDLKIGYMIKPNLAILLTSNVSIYDYSGFGRNRKRDFGVLSPSIQYWLSSKFWILGGIGIGGDNPVFWDIKDPNEDNLETKYYSGFGAVTSIGYELFQIKEKAIVDIIARVLYRNVKLQEGSTKGISYGILLGVNFY